METIQVNIHEAGAQLPKLIMHALSGKEVVISRDNHPLVRLDVLEQSKSRRKIGNAKGLVKFMADDFDEPLDDFKDYMA